MSSFPLQRFFRSVLVTSTLSLLLLLLLLSSSGPSSLSLFTTVVVNGLTASVPKSTTTNIQLGPLLSSCVDACQRGCDEIRKVQAKREKANNNGQSNNADLGVIFKDPNDSRSALTEADTNAQRVIVGSLRAEWWGVKKSSSNENNDNNFLKIIGEEDDDEELKKTLEDLTMFDPLDLNRFVDDIPTSDDDEDGFEPNRITVYIDPLDGTREFVEGRLENCQVLIGIAIDGFAVAGAIGLPFPKGNLTTESTIIYGVDGVGSGVVGELLTRGPYPLERNEKIPRPHIAASDAKLDLMDACRKGAIAANGRKGSVVTYGGAGNKILAAALGEVSCSIQHCVGGPWDLCAPHAVLKAMGGTMTDLFGDEIQIYDTKKNNCNEKGYLATPANVDYGYHSRLAQKMMTLKEVQEYKEQVEEKAKKQG